MREMPINDFSQRNGRIREDGRIVHDMYVYEVKKPSESKGEWDYFKLRAVRIRQIGHLLQAIDTRHIADGGFGLIVSHQTMEAAPSIEYAIDAALRQLRPSLAPNAGRAAQRTYQ
jgi:hypothetical protein